MSDAYERRTFKVRRSLFKGSVIFYQLFVLFRFGKVIFQEFCITEHLIVPSEKGKII